VGAEQGNGSFTEERAELFASVRTVGDKAIVTGEPNFTDWLRARDVVVPGTKIVISPNFADVARLDQKGSHFG
jgi:hypothetical protein